MREFLRKVPTDVTKEPEKQRYHKNWLNSLEELAEIRARNRAILEYAGVEVTLFQLRDGQIPFNKRHPSYEMESVIRQGIRRRLRRQSK